MITDPRKVPGRVVSRLSGRLQGRQPFRVGHLARTSPTLGGPRPDFTAVAYDEIVLSAERP